MKLDMRLDGGRVASWYILMVDSWLENDSYGACIYGVLREAFSFLFPFSKLKSDADSTGESYGSPSCRFQDWIRGRNSVQESLGKYTLALSRSGGPNRDGTNTRF